MGGCTAICAFMTDTQIILSNLGDSRAIICERDGDSIKIVRNTIDHKPELQDEKKRIELAKGYVNMNRVNGNLNLSRSVADFEYKQDKNIDRCKQQVIADPDIYEYTINKNTEFMILACDGVWDCWSNTQVANFVWSKIRANTNLTDIIQSIFHQICPEKTTETMLGTDNMTCVIVRFKK